MLMISCCHPNNLGHAYPDAAANGANRLFLSIPALDLFKHSPPKSMSSYTNFFMPIRLRSS